jgi:hypothetical protein
VKSPFQHIIQHEIWEVEFADADLAPTLQQRLSELLKGEILRITDEICQNLDPAPAFLSIESLTIDLPPIALDELDSELPYHFRYALQEKLGLAIARAKVYPTDTQQLISRHQSAWTVLQHFWETGALPWYAESYATTLLHSATGQSAWLAMLKTILPYQTDTIKDWLRKNIKVESRLLRIVRQMPDEALFQLLNATIPAQAIKIRLLWADLATLEWTQNAPSLSPHQLREIFWQQSMFVGFQAETLTGEQFLTRLTATLFQAIIEKTNTNTAVFWQYWLRHEKIAHTNPEWQKIITELALQHSSLERLVAVTDSNSFAKQSDYFIQLLKYLNPKQAEWITEVARRFAKGIIQRNLQFKSKLIPYPLSLDFSSFGGNQKGAWVGGEAFEQQLLANSLDYIRENASKNFYKSDFLRKIYTPLIEQAYYTYATQEPKQFWNTIIEFFPEIKAFEKEFFKNAQAIHIQQWYQSENLQTYLKNKPNETTFKEITQIFIPNYQNVIATFQEKIITLLQKKELRNYTYNQTKEKINELILLQLWAQRQKPFDKDKFLMDTFEQIIQIFQLPTQILQNEAVTGAIRAEFPVIRELIEPTTITQKNNNQKTIRRKYATEELVRFFLQNGFLPLSELLKMKVENEQKEIDYRLFENIFISFISRQTANFETIINTITWQSISEGMALWRTQLSADFAQLLLENILKYKKQEKNIVITENERVKFINYLINADNIRADIGNDIISKINWLTEISKMATLSQTEIIYLLRQVFYKSNNDAVLIENIPPIVNQGNILEKWIEKINNLLSNENKIHKIPQKDEKIKEPESALFEKKDTQTDKELKTNQETDTQTDKELKTKQKVANQTEIEKYIENEQAQAIDYLVNQLAQQWNTLQEKFRGMDEKFSQYFELLKAQNIDIQAIQRTPDALIFLTEYFIKHQKLPDVLQGKDISIAKVLRQLFLQHIAAFQSYLGTLSTAQIDQLRVENADIIQRTFDRLKKTEEDAKRPKTDLFKAPTIEMHEGVYVRNAGLVLLHPYLGRLFKLQGLTEKNAFKDLSSAHKATHLLHYLAFKTDMPDEYELVLNKVLCGIPMDEPIEKEITLTEADKEACESLLQGIIQNWGALGKSSPDALREGFLQREGRLELHPENWHLKVAQKGVDVLLDHLPWGIGTIKLMWMPQILLVEWS